MRIEFNNVSYEYRSLVTDSHVALSRVSFSVESGGLVAVVGASGSGKTTLIQQINGLLQPTSGWLRVGDEKADSGTQFKSVRDHVGLVFQFPEIQLFEETVYSDVAFGPRNLGWSGEKVERQVRQAMALVGLDAEHFGPLHPFELSGGEKRRVAIAGVLAMEPMLLILDEPTAGLDWQGTQKIESIIRQYHDNGRTVLFVSHDMDLVARLADRILVLHQGRLIFDGSKTGLFQQPNILDQAGLEIPHMVQAVHVLQKKGIGIPGDIYTLPEAREALEHYFHSRKD